MEHLQGLRSFNFLTLPSSISSWIIHKFAVAVIIIWHERDKMKHLWTHDHLKATGSHQVCWKSQGKTLRHIYSRGARAELILGGFFSPLPKKLQFVCSTSIPGTLYIPIWKRNEALLKWMPNPKTKVNEIFNGIS